MLVLVAIGSTAALLTDDSSTHPAEAAAPTTYFVSPLGDDSDGLSEGTAFRSPQRAADVVDPGDTVVLMDGVYESGPQSNGVTLTRSGTADAWITFTAAPGATPVIKAQAWLGFSIEGAQYVLVDGLTVEGVADEVDEAEALRQQDTDDPRVLNNCFGVVANPDDPTDTSHHITIRNSVARDCSGAGMYTFGADYVTFEYNQIYRNARWSSYANSGVSMYQSRDVDESTDVKMVIRGNAIYSNENRVPFRFSADDPADRTISDGNGIIIDDGRNTQSFVGPAGVPYRGRTVIENNLVLGNGGRGIHVFLSDHVTIVNNTTSGNSWTPSIEDGEITAIEASDVFIGNNIAFASDDRPAFTVFPSPERSPDEVASFGVNLTDADPLFLDGESGDFRLQDGSPAIDAGDPDVAPAVDYDGAPRPQSGGVDLGAYER
jgi:parallel beta-helix repeat protein